ncbi:MAG TPA: CBS domain-containing protein [Jiangellales bacterium]|nr:CBS domain-containing protein [Jiangellales bacterium]
MTESAATPRTVVPEPGDPARAIMVSPVVEVGERASLREVAALLTDEAVGAVLVRHQAGDAVGIISERDVVRALAEGGDPDEVWAADVMTAPVLWVGADDSISSVAELMELGGVRHVPVKDHGRTMGMISVRDVLDVLV